MRMGGGGCTDGVKKSRAMEEMKRSKRRQRRLSWVEQKDGQYYIDA